MERFVGYVSCECPEHGTVCAKHSRQREGGGGELHFYVCPGTPEDTGGCTQMLTSLGTPCDRPDWAEYPDEH